MKCHTCELMAAELATVKVRLTEYTKLWYDEKQQRIDLETQVRVLQDRIKDDDRELAAVKANEQELFERLSTLLTGGNAQTWEHIKHAIEALQRMEEVKAFFGAAGPASKRALERLEAMGAELTRLRAEQAGQIHTCKICGPECSCGEQKG
jgi:chromosome segregation ATPase